MPRPFTGKTHTGIRRVVRPNGDVYVYQRVTQYDPETRKTKTIKSTLLGILDPKTGKTRPTRGKSEKKEVVAAESARTGTTDILEWVGRQTGISEHLRNSFAEPQAQKIDTVARYLIATDGAPMPRIESWQISHPTPYAPGLSEDVYGDLFRDVGRNEDGRQKYFANRASVLSANPSIAFDSTTISTYSSNQTEARQGFNKDGDGLKTIKLLTLYSVADKQPIAFAKQPGNIPDIISIKNTIKQIKCFPVNKPLVVTDNGFCSQNNLTEFAHNNMKFLTLIRTSVSWVREEIDAVREKLGMLDAVCPSDHTISGASRLRMHKMSIVRQRTRGGITAGDSEEFERRMYVHVFFNHDRVVKDEQNLIADLFELKKMVEDEIPLTESGQAKANKYLTCSRAGRGGKLKVSFNDKAFQEAKRYFGFFVLISNEVKNADEALQLYREREKIEEMFSVQKNSLDGRRPRVWYPDNLKGRMFCQFVALGYHSFLTKSINELKARLGKVAEGKTEAEIDLESNLKRWLDSHSLIQILEWFDCVETTSVKTDRGMCRWSTESIRRDKLFLRLLGVTA